MKDFLKIFMMLLCMYQICFGQTIFFKAIDTLHQQPIKLDSVYVRLNPNGADTMLYNNPAKLEIGKLLGIDEQPSVTKSELHLNRFNFFNNGLYVTITSTYTTNIEITLTDLTGNILLNKVVPCTQGVNDLFINVASVSCGVYFFSIGSGLTHHTFKIFASPNDGSHLFIPDVIRSELNTLTSISDLTIIGYSSGKMVKFFADTIESFEIANYGNDTVQFNFGDIWSNWNFSKAIVNVDTIRISGDYTYMVSDGHNISKTNSKIDGALSFNFNIENVWANYPGGGDKSYSAFDTIRLSHGVFNWQTINPDSTFRIQIIVDTSKSEITNIYIANMFKTKVIINSILYFIEYEESLSYTGNLKYYVDGNGKFISKGLLSKEFFHYTRHINKDWHESYYYTSEEYCNSLKINDLMFELILEP